MPGLARQVGTKEEEEIRSNFNRSARSLCVIHRLRRCDAATAICGWPVALIENEDGPHFPPDRSRVHTAVVDHVVVVWSWNEDWRCGGTGLSEREQCH